MSNNAFLNIKGSQKVLTCHWSWRWLALLHIWSWANILATGQKVQSPHLPSCAFFSLSRMGSRDITHLLEMLLSIYFGRFIILFVCLGCHNKILWTRWFREKWNEIHYGSGDLASKMKVERTSICLALFLVLKMAFPWLCPGMVFTVSFAYWFPWVF